MHVTRPSDLDQFSRLRRAGQLGIPHEHHDSLESTNDRALAWCSEGAPHGALVTADQQSRGRGRRGRSWSSPPGLDLYASLIVWPPTPIRELGALGLSVAVGIREALLGYVREVALKWPNDVLIGGRKIAGILCEARWSGDEVRVVIGFGINIGRQQFPEELNLTATSLALVTGRSPPARAEVLAGVLDALQPVLDRFFSAGFEAVRPQYEPHCVVLGRRILVQDREGEPMRPALALGLDPDGALRIRGEGGERRLETGDVWLLTGQRE